jgi:hypothetical protein
MFRVSIDRDLDAWNRCRRQRPAARRASHGPRHLGFEQLEVRRVLSFSGNVFSGTISPIGDVDDETEGLFFNVTANDLAAAGGQIVATLSLSGANGSFLPVARVFLPSGNQLNGTLFSGDKVQMTLTQAGSYAVRIQDNDNNATGTYAVNLEGLRPPSLDAEDIDLGDVTVGGIGLMGEVDEYLFSAGVGDVVTLSLADTGFGSYSPRAELFAPSGQTVDIFSTTTGQRRDAVTPGDKLITQQLVEAGTYVVQVFDNNYMDTGSYALAVEGISPPSEDAIPILPGDVRTGAIAAGEVDAYSFTGFAGSIVTVSLSDAGLTSGADLLAEVYAPSGQELEKLPGTSGPDEVEKGERVVYVLPETGTYVIQVHDSDLSDTDVYGLALEGVNPPSLHTPAMTFGQSRDGLIDVMGDVDAYRFTITSSHLAAGGGQFRVSVSLTSEESARYRPQATLFAPSGEQVGSQVDAGQTEVMTLVTPGTYVIQVHDDDFTQTVADLITAGEDPYYTLTLQDLQAAQPPSVLSVTASPTVISEATVGPGQFSTTVLFSETMNAAIAPTLLFGNATVAGGPPPTLENPVGSWSSTNVPNDTFTAVYDVADLNVEIADITIDVTQAQDIDGNVQLNYLPEPEFSIDTRSPAVTALAPADNATGVSLNANLRITFRESIQVGTGNIVVRRTSDGGLVEAIGVGDGSVTVAGATATIDPSVTLAEVTGYYVEVDSGAFLDLAGNAFAGITGSTAWNFTTAGLAGTTAQDDTAFTPEDIPVDIPVLSNDSSGGQPLDPATVALVAGSGPLHGTATVDMGVVTYVPAANFSGIDSFRYTVRDAAGLPSNAATVTITVEEVADFQNRALPEDTNASGAVSPLDVLAIINYINGVGAELPPDPVPPETPDLYYDVNGDGSVTAQDVLLVVNYLNGLASGAGVAVPLAGVAVLPQTGSADRFAQLPRRVSQGLLFERLDDPVPFLARDEAPSYDADVVSGELGEDSENLLWWLADDLVSDALLSTLARDV